MLKQQASETQLSTTVGTIAEHDGDLVSASVNKGLALGADGGYLNLSLEARRRGETNRAGLDTLRVDPPKVTQRIGDSLAKDVYEYRNDNYQIEAGEPVSYQYGRTNNPAIRILDQTGAPATSGMQGFPGYTPSNAVDAGRHNIALYLDAEHKLNENLLAGAAVRVEKY